MAESGEERLQRVEAILAELQGGNSTIWASVEGHAAALADFQRGLDDIREGYGDQLRDLNRWLNATIVNVRALNETPILPSPELQAAGPGAKPTDALATVRRQLEVWTVMTFLGLTHLTFDGILISVVVSTRDRLDYLRRAVASVLGQRHGHLELLVVDDGSSDGTAAWLAGVDDARLRVVTTPGVGESAARNLALDRATGSIVTYLDDDNAMHPGWLHAVAWAFDRWPDRSVLYGARINEDAPALGGRSSGAMPSLEWFAHDRDRLELNNYIDLNVLAHRVGLPEARFDESLYTSVDWQLALALTGRYEPLELPVVACLYSTYAPNRLSDDPKRMEASRRIRSLVHTTRPMRVLAHCPRPTPAAVEEVRAMGAAGAAVGISTGTEGADLDCEVWADTLEATAALNPDVVVWFAALDSAEELQAVERTGRPFAVRGPGSQGASHPRCIGVWPGQASAADLSQALTAWRLRVG